jgi:membrane peptidoglycan carboxypeptidase
MTSVYSVFANDGVRNPATGILLVQDAQGNKLEEFIPQPETVLDHNAVRKLSSVLSDNAARTPLFGPNSFFYFGSRDVAGKTGTTNDNKDAWVLGYAPNIAVGVWTGNNDNTPMKKGSAISGPAWRTFMDAALEKLPNESFPAPEPDPEYYNRPPVFRGAWAGGESFFVDTISGKLATEYTPIETKKEYVIPNPHSILYWLNPNNPNSDSQYPHWEASVQNWLASHPGLIPPTPNKPTGYDDVHTLNNQPVVTISNPLPGSQVGQTTQVNVLVSFTTNYTLKKIDYYLNDNFIGSSPSNMFDFTPSDVGATSGPNTLKVVVTDTAYNKGESSVTINVQ